MKRILAFFLVAALLCGVLAGCSTVGDIAQNVANAAMEELKNQVTATLEKNKVSVVEMKSDYRLKDGSAFFVAVLVRCESEEPVQLCVTGLEALFTEAGYRAQTGQTFAHDKIPSGSITFDHTDYEGPYYVVYGYANLENLNLQIG